jgi:Dipeptidyl peptidase IV (DPP IV) N-terminal region.
MRRYLAASFFVLTVSALGLSQQTDLSQLTLDRIFKSRDFAADNLGAVRWLRSGDAYTRLEQAPNGKKGLDLVAYNAATGARQVLVSAEKLVPAGSNEPLEIQNYDWSADDQKLLIYTSSKKVWRQNTRGDYWVLDLKSGSLAKLGGADAKPSTLMFAKFSPDGRASVMFARAIFMCRISERERPLR